MCSAKAFLLLFAVSATCIDAFSTPNPRSNSHHDYTRDPADVATNVDIGEINALLAQRLDARKAKRYRLADSIRDHLRTSFGVEIDDAALLWSASPDANFGGGERSPRQNRGSRFGPNGHDYKRTGGPMHASCKLSENEIHSLLAERLQCKLDRNYKKADNIQHMMWDSGVRIHDGRRQWRYDGGSFADDDGSATGGRQARTRIKQRSKGAGCSKSPYSEPISQEDEAYVADLIEKRMEAKRIKNYETADGIKEELLNMMNVHIDDSLRSWSVGGNFGDNRRYFDGEEYFFVGDSDKVEPKTLGIIKKAIAKRSEYKRHRNYDEADNIRDRLRETFGISVDDKRKCYYFEKEFQVKKEKPMGQKTRANIIDDSKNDHKEIPWGDEMEDEYGEEGGTFVEETSTDGSEKVPMLVPVVDSYAKASGSDTSKLSAEDEAYISQRLSRRVEAWNERDFDTANAIEVELAMGFNVGIDDELGQWSVGAAAGAAAAGAAEGSGSGGSTRTVTSTENEKASVLGDDATGTGTCTCTEERSTLESLTIPVLKEKLRERGLKVSGKKGDLIDRLLK